MEENKIFSTEYNKESYLSVIHNDNDDFIFEEYDLNNEKEKKQEFEPQQISKEKQVDSNMNNQQVNNQQQVNVLLCQICNGTFWSPSAYNLHWSCKKNLKCGYCCLYGHTISKCPTLNKPIKDIIE